MVTYVNGETEKFERAAETQLGDRNSETLEVRGHDGLLAVLVVRNIRKWEWVTSQ